MTTLPLNQIILLVIQSLRAFRRAETCCVCRIALMASQCFDQGFHQGHADMTAAHKKNMLRIKEKRGQPCDTN